jgi:hypothetical protein
MDDDKKEATPEHHGFHCENKYWWATLVVAVLAVPSFGIIIALMTNTKGLVQVWVFILACWFCTYLGMRVMHNPKMQKKLDIHVHHKNQ